MTFHVKIMLTKTIANTNVAFKSLSNERTHHKDKQHKRKEKYVCMQ